MTLKELLRIGAVFSLNGLGRATVCCAPSRVLAAMPEEKPAVEAVPVPAAAPAPAPEVVAAEGT